jgi:hypothetical protein
MSGFLEKKNHTSIDCILSVESKLYAQWKSINPLAPRRQISAAKKSQYSPRQPILATCKTSFLDRSQRHLLINFGTITTFPGARQSLVLNACGFYISWCTKFGQIFHLNLGARLAIHGSMHNGI